MFGSHNLISLSYSEAGFSANLFGLLVFEHIMAEFFSYLKKRFSYREVLNTVGGITIYFPRGLQVSILSRTLSSSLLFLCYI